MLKETLFSSKVLTIITHLLLIVVGVTMIVPFLWMFSTSLKDVTELYEYPPKWIPSHLNWQNYIKAMELAPFGRFYLNSLLVTFCITLGQMITACLAAYVFARIEFPGRDILFVIYLSTMIIPVQVTIIPLFLIVKQLGWFDTYQGLIIPFIARAFPIIFLRQFFMTLPKDLEDAAKVDGCGHLRFLWKILLPTARPALSTIGLFTFLFHWRDYLWPLVITNTTEMRTLPVGLRYFVSEQGTQFHYMMAASIIVTIPIVLIYLFAQKQFIKGVTMTGLKG
ncbi:carbohydrate ABC transporter permease [bacterium]|nr:carbohydrate ABC transporter permease [bacterium]MBU1063524.1 carbohydrate ABC transporter permease [bacterium]MBU1634104.1 carbohydrate ABC transporter permease [bacterium]MBU1872531.1 carbohydrate ABC transporter permease [bacterium]